MNVVVPAFRPFRPAIASRPGRRVVAALALAVACGLVASAARASGPLLFQHGGRATAQAGAFVGRATDAGGLDYNPAVIARLQGSHYQLGFDYTAPLDDYKSATGAFRQKHLVTESPSIYASWHLPKDYYPLAFGIGVDHRAWYRAEWEAALFPGRFDTRLQRLELWSVHPVVAYQLGEHWSVGAGVRYYLGTMEEGRNQVVTVGLTVPPEGSTVHFPIEFERSSDADVDGFSFDAGLHYGAERWGWGLAFDSGGEVEGNGDVHYAARDVPNTPGLSSVVAAVAQSGSSHQSFDLPQELRTGLWVAPSPAWSFELDVALTGWSSVDATEVSFSRHLFALPTANPQPGPGTERRERRWEDTLSVRLGTEVRVAERWWVSAGAAMEPSPVPDSTVEPGFARGDALVLGTGITYRIRNIAFDLGYSFFQYDDRGAGGQELQHPQVSSTYEAHEQVFGFSVSWGG